jgi:anti-sigma factor RsiW
MTHPEDLLAAYVDGALTEKERAAVDVHLSSCETCREELALASDSMASLASLPEEPVPFGVTGPVLAEARRGAKRREPVWSRLQWVAGLAAAASIVLVVALLLPQLGGSNENAARETAPALGSAADSGGAEIGAGGVPQLEVLQTDFDEAGVAALAKEAAASAKAPAAASPDAGVTFVAPDEAISCLRASQAPLGEGDTLVRVIDASYLGTPVHIGVFLEGPGAGQSADRAVVWIVKQEDCSIVTIASQRIR